MIHVHSLVISGPGGGESGTLHPHVLQSIVYRPMMTFGGADLYPTIWKKVAALVHETCLGHAFVDGNKRTAFVCGDLVLKMNGHRIATSTEEGEEFFRAIAQGQKDVDEIAAWMQLHAEPYPG